MIMATLRGKKTEPAKKENKVVKIEEENKFEVVVNELPELKAQVFEEVPEEVVSPEEPIEESVVETEIEEVPEEVVFQEKPKRTAADLNVSEMRMYQRTGIIPE